MRHDTISVTGVPFTLRRVGHGAPLLLTHGVPGDARGLAPVADHLSKTHEAITVSLRADPPEVRPNRPFGTASQMEDLRDLLEALDMGPVHLVAWSYSAHAAMGLALARPDLLRSLHLHEPGFPTFVTKAEERRIIEEDTMAAFGPVFEALSRGDGNEAMRRAIDGAANEPGWFDRQPEENRRVHLDNAEMLAMVFRQTPPLPLGPEDLARIALPTTVSWGERTRLCYAAVSRAAARLIPGATGEELPDAGHLLPEQDPARFAAHVARHVARVEAGE